MSLLIDDERSRTRRRSTGCAVGFWVWVPQLASPVGGTTTELELLELPPLPPVGSVPIIALLPPPP
jgi:hypothetical protein